MSGSFAVALTGAGLMIFVAIIPAFWPESNPFVQLGVVGIGLGVAGVGASIYLR